MLRNNAFRTLALFFMFCAPSVSFAQAEEPREWIDKETGHRLIKVTQEPYSSLPYFTSRATSVDGKFLAYSSPKGLHLVDLSNFENKLILSRTGRDLRIIEMGRKEPRLYYSIKNNGDENTSLESIDIYTNKIRVHASLPDGCRVESLNADETLAAGVSEDVKAAASAVKENFNGKADVLYRRFGQKIPMTLFTVNLNTGVKKDIYKSTEWLSHPQFSPTNPSLLMYSLEGPWHWVDRIWTINANGTNRKLIHNRTMQMEITGHEFWSQDGKFIHYDWQYPKGKVFFLASYNVTSGLREAAVLSPNQWSIHFNSSTSHTQFIGDGADDTQVSRSSDAAYIYSYEMTDNSDSASKSDLVKPSQTKIEKLVDMRGHDYKLEPNVRLSPDNNWIFFNSNMFGAPAVFAVQMTKASPNKEMVRSTLEIATARKNYYKNILMKN